MEPFEIFKKYQDKEVINRGYIAGWFEDYVILGFSDNQGEIKELTPPPVICNLSRCIPGTDRFDFHYKSYSFVRAADVELYLAKEILKNVCKYCEDKAVWDKLGNYGDFYYKAKKICG